MTAKIGSNIAVVRACHKKSGISARVGIGSKVGIGVSSSKDIFRPFRVPFLLYKALSIVYSKGVSKWASPCQLKMWCSYCIALIVFYC